MSVYDSVDEHLQVSPMHLRFSAEEHCVIAHDSFKTASLGGFSTKTNAAMKTSARKARILEKL